MSASLVGSEMCIRDRHCTAGGHDGQPSMRAWCMLRGGSDQQAPRPGQSWRCRSRRAPARPAIER
eukprot:10502762-Alexandrium_andersonii.AAC.1